MMLLNLLPDERKEAVKYTIYYYYGLRIGLLLIFVSLVVIVGFKILEIKLEKDFASLNETEKELSRKNFDLTQRVTALNNNLSKIEGIQKDFLTWSDFMYSITSEFPATGITVSNFTISRDAGTFSIMGLADSREAFLHFKETLEKNQVLENVNSPLKNILDAGPITFTVTGGFFAKVLKK